MKVILFGASGTVGRLAVDKMLAGGCEVTAFARHPEKLRNSNPNLTRVAGDVMDPEAVANAVRGHDAVVVTLGSGMSRKGVVRSQGTLNVIQAMQRNGVRRLICQSTLGAHESWDNLNFFWKRIMFGLVLRPVFRDHELQEQLVRASGLDWTIVRPSAFTDDPASGRYREGFSAGERNLALKISRSDVAEFLKRQLKDTTYVNRAVGISN
ncbi:SDR family oxidoreductase [Hoeflea sp. WL0058]|uniref:SDR family oxidoreductase n=1 Tax=Flavimaribacter sediminis TaxID=2865987 RepID=A0AAE2ZMX5_9HYPH|nr:NAD(P)-binding oxidoreductase [Flavimaribacter sediminis]MBW8637465.1 SDR family oxidoreductase [Flavimaribacter sediminis]